MPRFLSSIWRKTTLKSPSKSKPAQQKTEPLTFAPKQQDGTLLDPIILSTPHLTTTRPAESFPDCSMGNCTWHNLISSPSTNSDTFTIGIGVCEPKTGNLALHRHKQAEFYYVLSGSGVVRIEGKDNTVTTGDVVFIPGNAEHGVFNREAEEFRWLYCFGVGSFQEIVYRFTKAEEDVRR